MSGGAVDEFQPGFPLIDGRMGKISEITAAAAEKQIPSRILYVRAVLMTEPD